MDIDCKSLTHGIKIVGSRAEIELLHKALCKLVASTKDIPESETITFENKVLIISRIKGTL